MGCLHYSRIIIVICMCSAHGVCVHTRACVCARVLLCMCVKFSLFPCCLTLKPVYADMQTGDEFSQVIY